MKLPWNRPQAMYCVYCAYDPAHTPLYTGATKNFYARLRAHARRSPWFGDMAMIAVWRFHTAEDAAYTEALLITELRPTHNAVAGGSYWDSQPSFVPPQPQSWPEYVQFLNVDRPRPSLMTKAMAWWCPSPKVPLAISPIAPSRAVAVARIL